jgi:hypothetical protein
MEGMVQAIAQDCADVLDIYIKMFADLLIRPDQHIKLLRRRLPKKAQPLTERSKIPPRK